MLQQLAVNQRQVALPIFCPDATRGVVRSLGTGDLQDLDIPGLIVNTWHLHQYPGATAISQLGGIKSLMNYQGLVISDSGGFQVFSLFQKKPDYGRITDDGLVTYTDAKKQHRLLFRPEDSIAMQFTLGSDIMICLDDFTAPGANPSRARESVERTIEWARRCRVEFYRQLEKRGLANAPPAKRPQLFAVIQGDQDLALRKYCAKQLLALGFDGYGLGGMPFRPDGKLDLEVCKFNASLTPAHLPRYALGFGKPDDIVNLYHLGYTIFDCVLPTRDARHGRLYITSQPAPNFSWEFLHLKKSNYQLDLTPLDHYCTCPTCRHHSRAYLHHLFKISDSAFYRLATIHNLHFYRQLLRALGNGEISSKMDMV